MDLMLKMFVLFSLITSAIFTQVPSSGCDLITSENKCFSYFTHSGINRNDARANCQTWRGDLASIASAAENTAVDSIRSSSDEGSCWIGLHDIGTEGTFSWSDGSCSSYRNWNSGQPDDFNDEDCVQVRPNTWNDLPCSQHLSCYYCSLLNVNVFGRIVGSSTFEGLNNKAILTLDTTLYCVAENKNTPQVTWSYEDPDGIKSSLTVATNVNTGVSILELTNSNRNPGTYSCHVTRNQVDVTYTAEIISTSALSPSIQSPLTRIETLTDIFPAWLPISITIALILLISLVINLVLITAVVFLLRKINFLNSEFDPSKPAPSHLYERIDLGEMSDSISSPTQQQSTQDYVPIEFCT